MKRLEHWNWAHAKSQAGWLKLLLPGEQLKPEYVARLGACIEQRPHARFIRCDAVVQTDWGPVIERAPFPRPAVGAAEFMDYFPRSRDWISRSVNVACQRTAWLAAGGYATQLPGLAVLNFNVIQALHHGVENLPETLASVDSTMAGSLNGNGAERVNAVLELWLILRQAQIYCLAAKRPWPAKHLLLTALTAAWAQH